MTGNKASCSNAVKKKKQLRKPFDAHFTLDELRVAMVQTIAQINRWQDEAGVTEASLMNFAVSTGSYVLVTRYNNRNATESASLFYSSGT